jgi:hypothetical protein
MPNTYKILGQITGSATIRPIYTTPAATQSVVSSIVIANRGTNNMFYRIAAITSGSTLDNQHYLAYDVPLSGSDSVALTLGISLNSGQRLEGYASGSSVSASFSAFGTEIF